ncbi:hypothetical protein ACFV08_28370 [Streptomyces fradiae]|uniref:hypothetical protein n=1 Tax=Streptomyces fradiae TaxID=1906 RepID=UPI0036BD7B2E
MRVEVSTPSLIACRIAASPHRRIAASPHRRDDGVRCVTELLALAGRTMVHDPGRSGQAVLRATASPQPHRPGLDPEAEGREFGGLGLLA